MRSRVPPPALQVVANVLAMFYPHSAKVPVKPNPFLHPPIFAIRDLPIRKTWLILYQNQSSTDLLIMPICYSQVLGEILRGRDSSGVALSESRSSGGFLCFGES